MGDDLEKPNEFRHHQYSVTSEQLEAGKKVLLFGNQGWVWSSIAQFIKFCVEIVDRCDACRKASERIQQASDLVVA